MKWHQDTLQAVQTPIPNFISNTLLTRSRSIKPLRPRPSGEAAQQGRDGEGSEHNNTSIIIRKAGRERKRKKTEHAGVRHLGNENENKIINRGSGNNP